METIYKGLDGVFADETQISKVIPETSALLYRGYPVADLVQKISFEEVVYLLWNGELPDQKDLDKFKVQEVKKRPHLSQDSLSLMEKMKDSHPMDSLRTMVSYWGAIGAPWDETAEQRKEKSLRFLAAVPIFIATHFRLRKNLTPIPPNPKLSFCENFFHMCFDELPDEKIIHAFNGSMTLYAEHSFNASTFAARVIASTTSDVGSALSGAIGALKGPLHGGANEKVMEMMKEIKEPQRAKKWMLDALSEKRKIMGFGHRVYKKQDSRVATMYQYAKDISALKKENKWIEIYDILEKTMKEEKNIYPNVDLPAGPAYYLMGFDIDMFTPLFVMARVSGWTAHIMEQRANNRIIRPLSVYKGHKMRRLQ